MTDILIRNLSSELKRKLKDSASKHHISLSDEAKRLLDQALADVKSTRPLGSALVEHFKDIGPVELDIPRNGMPDTAPDFE